MSKEVAVAMPRQLVQLGPLMAAACLVFWPTLQDIWHSWLNNPQNSHGFLVPAVSAWLVWGRRRELVAEGGPGLGGLVLLLGGLALYLAGIVGFVRFLAALGVVASLSGLAWFNLGSKNFRLVAFDISTATASSALIPSRMGGP